MAPTLGRAAPRHPTKPWWAPRSGPRGNSRKTAPIRSASSVATWAIRNSCSAKPSAKRARRARNSRRSKIWASSLMAYSVTYFVRMGLRPIMALMAMSETGVPPALCAVDAPKRLGLVATMLASLADLLLPPVCIVCRTRIGEHGLICGACFAEIDFIAAPLCARLGVPLPYETGGPNLSASAIANPPAYDRARAAAHYLATMRDLIQSFKYRDRHEGLPLFGRWLVKAGQELLEEADILVPVPLYRARLWSRRFNQSALLAQQTGRLSGVAVDCFVLKRVRATASQVGL